MAEVLERITAALSDRFTVEGEIGRGGMATVFLATDLQLGRKVAVKVLRPELSSAIGPDRFRREITIAAGLNHPHIVAVHDSGEADGLLYFVMPYVEGRTLRDELDEQGRLPLEQAVGIMRDVAEGLDHAHSLGIVHRDIKPRNILLSGGHALIADFGVARAFEAAGGTGLTSSGIAIGTPAYMSPEQATGDRDIDTRSDVYSLGCVFYEMLSGELPFRAKNVQALLSLHVAGTAPSLTRARKDIPLGVAEAVDRALAKSPDERFATATDFFAQVAAATTAEHDTIRTRWRRLHRRFLAYSLAARTLMLMAALAIATGAALLVANVIGGPPPWIDGRPSSVLVLPFSLAGLGSADEDERLTSDVTDALNTELDAYVSVTTVPHVALAGPMFDLGLTGPPFARDDDGISLARHLNVQALLAVTVQTRGDSAFAEAVLYDAARDRRVGDPFRARGLSSSPLSLARAIAAEFLRLDPGLADAPHRYSANTQALEQFAEGQRQLERWRLLEAERSFRAAIRLDSTFSMAHHRLAQTLYWLLTQEMKPVAEAAPEIARESAAAVRHSSGLGARDSLHIRAFFDFQEGDLEAARNTYNTLTARDPNDVYALLMLGSVEYSDSWLTQSDTGGWYPRGNLNTAKQAFEATTDLQPAFELGYGHLSDIRSDVVDGINGNCLIFEEPTGEMIAPWDQPPFENMHVFCPAPLDSLVWLSRSELEDVQAEAAQGADLLFRTSLGGLRRWVDYSPTEPKPRNELVAALLAERARMRATAIERQYSMVSEALLHADSALALNGDTLVADLVQLANLHLAADSIDRALELAELALAWDDSATAGVPQPESVANAFLAVGQPTRALPLVAATTRRRSIRDPGSGELIWYGRAVSLIEELRVLAAAGVTGPAIRRELDTLYGIWGAPDYSPAQQALLRRSAALRAAPALLTEPGALVAWNEGLEPVSPLWDALVVSDTASTGTAVGITDALADTPAALGPASTAFLKGIVAARAGDHRTAAQQFSRMDSVPLYLHALDINWGMRWVARLHRAASYEALGDTDLALRDYEDLARAWSAADSLAAPLVETARRRAAAIRDGR